MFKTKKGQAAMEYLMTYGWALLVIVIVLALLLIILGGYLQGTPSCTFQEAGFVCNEPVVPVVGKDTLSSTYSALFGVFQHTQDEPIKVYGIAFVTGQVSKDNVCWQTAGGIEVPPRTPMKFSELYSGGGLFGGVLGCTPEGEWLTTTPLTPGEQVKGQLWIKYRYVSDDAIGFTGNRTATATVIANVE